jgi:DNA-directed RNA polymerase specialized sigma24 family protein
MDPTPYSLRHFVETYLALWRDRGGGRGPGPSWGDCLHEAVLKMLTGTPLEDLEKQTPEDLERLLRQGARSSRVDAWRRRAWQGELLDPTKVRSWVPDPAAQLALKEIAEDLERAFARLTAAQRLAIELRTRQGLSWKAVTVRMGLSSSEGAFECHRRGMRRLRLALARRMPGGGSPMAI